MEDKQEVANSLIPETVINCPSQNCDIKWSDAVPQILASLCSYAMVIQAGINLAYSAVLLPQLNSKSSDLVINSDQASWIGKQNNVKVYKQNIKLYSGLIIVKILPEM